jgi:hypothetical protein
LESQEILRLIWDFRGGDAAETAKHHSIHLTEFFVRERISNYQIGVQHFSEMWSTAYVDTSKDYLEMLKLRLKPHRAQLLKAQ